ncbi:unnamed protein product [Eruca vesicaria subsp. sativa]|uniref:RING-type E3 ubiquitin transferase n=1 Tax=Eruca vesicaria subsp. sativa TaxID=29727 RepID=A0ABC8M5E8_ERUVS|nr:unnamed protein product [Eruca vesicaria subsp. sativa]
MQEERTSLGYLSEALNFELGSSTSTSTNGVLDHWENIHSLGDNDLHDYMIANPEPVYHNDQQRNEVIDLDSDSEQPSESNQHVHNVNLNAVYIELDEDVDPVREPSGSSSVEGRREACKRKAFEGSIGQSSSGGYGGFHHGESSSWTPASVNISGSRGQVSSTVPLFPVSETAESSSRNTGQQETVNPAVFSAGSVVRQQHMSDLRHGQSLSNVFTQNSNSPAISIPPVSRNMLPPFQWREVSLAGGSSTSTVPVERHLHVDETRPRSIPENPLFIPSPQLRNVSSSQSSSGSLNIASSVSSNLAWTPYQNLPHQQRRRSELARRSLISSLAGSGDHPTLRSLAPPVSPDGLVLQPGGDNSHTPYSRAGQWLNRQGDSVSGGASHSFRALAAASRGRSRLTVSQMQNILDVMRRDPNHSLRLEDVMLLNQSLMFDGAAGMHDRYRDMRLDVDNMSYEELLALEERIGDVCTGVNEETISNRLKQWKFKRSTKSPQDAEPSCCVCQEEYSEGEDMGTLECGHEFHSQCIKEWLKQKNLCPICKTTGLNTAKKRKIG